MEGDIKYGVHVKSKGYGRKSKNESSTLTAPFEDDTVEKMMVVGKGFPLNRSRGLPLSFPLHDCHSDTSINPTEHEQHKDSFPTEGLNVGLSETRSVSSISFESAKSDFSVTEAMQKKIYELEEDLSLKDVTISILKKQLCKDGMKVTECHSVGVETDVSVGCDGDYEPKLKHMTEKISLHEKTISDLSLQLEETSKTKSKLLEDNRNLKHEINFLNRQLQSMYELVHSKHWDTGIDPKDFEKYKDKTIELEDALKAKLELLVQLQEKLKVTESDLNMKNNLLAETSKNFSELKDATGSEIKRLRDKIDVLEKDAEAKEIMFNDKISESQKNMEDEIVSITQKLEMQYQEDIKAAVEKCRSSFKKLSEMPKARIENILKLCESGKFDIMILQKDWEDHRVLLEKKVNALQEEKHKEVNRLIEGYESKIASLKSQIESLNEQLKERKETLDTFENELKLYRKSKTKEEDSKHASDMNELKQLHEAEILSEKEKHKLEKDMLEDKIKTLSEEIEVHANSEKEQLQELQNARLMATEFREKYEEVLIELEEKVNAKKVADQMAAINEIDLEDSLNQFKALIASLKSSEKVLEEKIQLMNRLDQEEMVIHQKEISVFKTKQDQADRFQNRLQELDTEIKDLVRIIEDKYESTVQTLTSCHYSEVTLKQLEVESIEQQNSSEITHLKKKIKELTEAKLAYEEELRLSRTSYEREKEGLRRQSEDLAVELLRNEGMLAIKSEIENTLTERVSQLEGLIERKNDNARKELGDALSKCLAYEAMLSAKDEIAREYEEVIRENVRILSRSNKQVDHIEGKCLKIEESFFKMENISETMYDITNCESYFALRKKIDHLIVEFEDTCAKTKDLEVHNDNLMKANSSLMRDKLNISEKFAEIQTEKNRLMENYQVIEKEMSRVMEQSRRFEGELRKMTVENLLIEEKCNDLLRKNFQEKLAQEKGSLLEKVEMISDELGKTLKEVENKKEMLRIAQEEIEKKRQLEKEELLEREQSLRLEQSEITETNGILRDSIRSLSERVDRLLMDLASSKFSKEATDIKVFYQEVEEGEGSESTSTISSRFGLQKEESSETLKYKLRCVVLTKENSDLKKENDELKIELSEKESEMSKVEWRDSLKDEMVLKLENIQRQISEVMYEKNGLMQNFANLAKERDDLKVELDQLQLVNSALQDKFKSELKEITERSCSSLVEELTAKEGKINEMKIEMRKLNDCVKTLTRELDLIKIDNENLLTESRHHLKNNQCLKDELEEVWSQKYEIEDQLTRLRRENAVLNLHRDQLEQTNKRISHFISDGSPSVVSWLKIHETVENIVDVVQTLKTSFSDLTPVSSKTDASKKEYRVLSDTLHLELESKTRLCQELVSQKLMLERELESLENLMKQSESATWQCEPTMEEPIGSSSAMQQYEQDDSECDSLPGNGAVDLPGEEVESSDREVAEEGPTLEKLQKLKKHFEDQVHLQETQLTKALENEFEGLKKEMDAGGRESCQRGNSKDCKHELELEKLREILKEVGETGNNSSLMEEMESKHAEQMEELRQYFERKCADLEKNYSEEVFSQHSRKMSSSSDTENEELPDESVPNEELVKGCIRILEKESGEEEKKVILLNLISKIASNHAEEVNCLKMKHNKEVVNLKKRYAQEIDQLNEELLQARKDADAEMKGLIRHQKDALKEAVLEERKNVVAELEREFEKKIKAEIDKFSELLLAETKAQERKETRLEESCMENLSAYQTESALMNIETEKELEKRSIRMDDEKFRQELEAEKMKIAQYYRELNERALRRFNEEQENLIKSHAEVMHRLIEDHEEKIAELKRAHKRDLERLQSDDELKKLATEFRNREKKLENELSSMKSTYEDELLELKKCCQDTLNEQVSLAKADAFNILQKQIENYLDGEEDGSLTSNEVIELGEKFAGRYRREIEELKERHQGEVTRIRSEYEERIKRRYSTGSLPKKSVDKMEMRTDDDKLQILRERDALQEMVSSLRHVLSELIRYVGSCEDELNNTIVGEFGKNDETVYKSFNVDVGELNESDCSSILAKRVHFAPDLSGILSEIDDSRSLNTSMQVRVELDRCLKQLKSDASHLLALSNPAKRQDENIYELLLKIEEEKNKLTQKVGELELMHKTLKIEMGKTKGKLAELERTREVVSEGYGEEVIEAQKLKSLTQLKEKAKALMGQHSSQPADISNILEEICKEGDRLQEESRREKNDLQQQVIAADKQLRSIRKFLEEQAAERETERDDYISEIKRLKETLKALEKDKAQQDRMNQEINRRVRLDRRVMEALENQLRDVKEKLTEVEGSKSDVENQLKEAVDKIWTLREIIREHEEQVASLSERESYLRCKIDEYESINDEHTRANRELMIELDTFKTHTRDEYSEHVKKLEEELSTLKRVVERSNPEAINQMRVNLREIELFLSKKTKDLEQLPMSSANVSCSSPSEDISMCERLDRTGCPTPDEMDPGADVQKLCLPFEEIDRINDKLIRHTRAEEIAIKTVRDLEIQLKSNRKALEEVQIERDVLLERVDNYVQENSRLQVRLDEQRCSAGILQRQLSADLEAQIKRLEFDIEKLNDLCNQKDKQIRDMNAILEQTTKSLKIREAEALNKSNEENELIINLKTELKNVSEEKKKLEESVVKMKETIRDTVTVPLLVNTMLEEKNAEIDRLEKEVTKLSNPRATSSLIRSKSTNDSGGSSKSLKRVKFTEPDSFVQFISPIFPEGTSVGRCASDSYSDLKISSQRLKRNSSAAAPESLSSIGPLQLSPRGASDLAWNTSLMPNEENELLRQELSEKTNVIKSYEAELAERNKVDAEISEIRSQLKAALDTVEQDKNMNKSEFEKMLKNESKLQSEIDSKRREIAERLLEIDTLKRKLIEVNLEQEKERTAHQGLKLELSNKDEEIRKFEANIESLLMTIETLKKNHLEEVEELQNKLNFEHNRVESVLGELNILEVKKVEIEEEFLSLREDYNEKLASEQKLVSDLKLEMEKLREKHQELHLNYQELEREMKDAVTEAENVTKGLASELSAMKLENEKVKNDYENLKSDWGDAKRVEMSEAEVQVMEIFCEGAANKPEKSEEFMSFQSNVEKLKTELIAWERRMDDGDLKRDEALSYAALIRTLLSSVIENLDNHFYELQTYRRKMMECSVDDLTDRVQKELLLSAKLDNKLLSNFQSPEGAESIDDGGGGDNNLSMLKKKQNLVNLTVKLYELETNLQDLEQRNKDFELQVATLKNEKEEARRRSESLQSKISYLEDRLVKEGAKLAEEKSRYEEDAKIMEALRINFETFVEKVDELERTLSIERKCRMTLEKQIKLGVERKATESSGESELRCQLEVERQKCLSLGAHLEKEKRKRHEMKMQLEQEKLERMTDKDVQRLMSKDMTLLQEQKNNLESQLSHSRELLQTRQSEIVALKRKLNLQEIDIKALTISSESQNEKESEISMMSDKISELELLVNYYRKQIETLTQKSDDISTPLLTKMKILNDCVEQHVQESNEMGEALLHLTQETEQMRSLIRRIEESTEAQVGSNSSDETIVAEGEEERKLWMKERENLVTELEKLKCDYDVLKKDSIDIFKGNDNLKMELMKLNKELEGKREEVARLSREKQIGIPEDRVLHLFAKYMKTESNRKALAFQKLYLTKVLVGYENGYGEELGRLARSGRKDFSRKRKTRTKRKSFRIVVLMIISIKRMQFMVMRWKMGRFNAFYALIEQYDPPSANKENECRRPSLSAFNAPIDPLRYQTHNFVRSPQQRASPVGNVLRTPPSRDPDSRTRHHLDVRKVTDHLEKFNNLQKNLGLPSRPP